MKQLGYAHPFCKKAQGNGAPANFTDEHEFHKLLKKEPSGSYAASGNGLWHGGFHISAAGAGSALDLKHGVRCMADGEVVAWRVNRKYLVSELPAHGDRPAIQASYSTGFALVRHSMEFPKDNKLTFFSLYMHLQDLASYERDLTLPRPPYWSPDRRASRQLSPHSCSQTLLLGAWPDAAGHGNLTFRIERNRVDWRPVSRVA